MCCHTLCICSWTQAFGHQNLNICRSIVGVWKWNVKKQIINDMIQIAITISALNKTQTIKCYSFQCQLIS